MAVMGNLWALPRGALIAMGSLSPALEAAWQDCEQPKSSRAS